jgi:hypothetical protein
VRFHSREDAESFSRDPDRARRVEDLKAQWLAARERLQAETQRRLEDEREAAILRRRAEESEKRSAAAKKAAATRRYQAILKPQFLARYGARRISWLGHLVATDLDRGIVTDAPILERAQHVLGSLSEPDAVVRLARERAQEIQTLRASRRSRASGTTATLEERVDAHLRTTTSEHISAACTSYLSSTPTYEIRLGAEPAVAYASSPIWPRYYSRRRYPVGHDYTVTITVPRSWRRSVLSVLGSALVQGHVVLDLQPTDRPQFYAATWLRKSRGYEPALVHGYVTRALGGEWTFAELEPVPLSSWERLTDTLQPEPRVRTRKGAAKGTPINITRAATLPMQSAASPMPSAPNSGGRRIRVLDLDDDA